MQITICDLCKEPMTSEERGCDYGVSFAGVGDDEPEADEICSVCYYAIKEFVVACVVSKVTIDDFEEAKEEVK